MVAGGHVIASLLLVVVVVVVVVVVDDYTYYWVTLRPSISSLSQSAASVITKCDSLFYHKVQELFYYKVRQNMAREIKKSLLITNLVKSADELRMNPDTCGLANLI